MYLADLIFDDSVPESLKRSIWDYLGGEGRFGQYLEVLVPTDENNDVDGSQHGSSEVNFTYREPNAQDLASVVSLGFYEYFSRMGDLVTGHYYDGDSEHYPALVLNPPTYAVGVYI